MPGLQVAQQVDHLFLHRAVQGRGGFVEQYQLRLHDQRPGNGDALALPARELMGVAMTALRIQAHFLQDPDHRRLAFLLSANVMGQQAFADDLLHRHARAQAAKRVLEHHLHLPAQRAQQVLAEDVELFITEADFAL